MGFSRQEYWSEEKSLEAITASAFLVPQFESIVKEHLVCARSGLVLGNMNGYNAGLLCPEEFAVWEEEMES